MPRIRTIKPEFPQSESMGRCSRDARLLFIQLWTLCDDAGRTRAASRMLASLLYPYDSDAPRLVDKWLAELEAENCIVRYMVDGQTYLEVRNWLNHQKIDRPSHSKIPPFDEASRGIANDREASSEDLRNGSKEGIKGIQGPSAKSRAAPSAPEGVSEQSWQDWLKARKAKGLPLTQSALEAVRREAVKAKMTLAQAITMAAENSWAGFKAEWVKVNGNGDKPWHTTASGVKQKGAEFGLVPEAFCLSDGRQDWQSFKAAVYQRAGVLA